MQDPISKKLLITGRFPTTSFVDWGVDRARKLSLTGWIRQHSQECIEVQISGDKVLVEAMEVACSLGPIDANVSVMDVEEIGLGAEVYRQPPKFVGYSLPE